MAQGFSIYRVRLYLGFVNDPRSDSNIADGECSTKKKNNLILYQ